VVRGGDPLAEKREAKSDITVAGICDLYMREGSSGKKPSTMVLDKSRIERHVKPLLGTRRLRDLSRADLERFMIDVATGKTATDERTGPRGRARVRGGKGTATRVMGMLGAMLQFAVGRGLRSDNPAKGIRRYPDRCIERFLSSDELSRLAASFGAAEKSLVNPYALATIRLLALTGARKSEILKTRWAWVDFERACLRLPDSKSGSKAIPLGSAAIDILRSLPRVNGNPFIIPGAKSGHHFVGLQKCWDRIRQHAGLPDLRLHDLRHHFISTGASSGESLYVLGKVAGHKNPSTTQRYAHLADDPVRLAAERISASIADSIRIVPDEERSEV
jgi:integrase